MQKLGITDSKQFIKRRLKEEGESLLFLQTCCIGKGIQDHIEAIIDEAVSCGSWVHTRVCLIFFVNFFVQMVAGEKSKHRPIECVIAWSCYVFPSNSSEPNNESLPHMDNLSGDCIAVSSPNPGVSKIQPACQMRPIVQFLMARIEF